MNQMNNPGIQEQTDHVESDSISEKSPFSEIHEQTERIELSSMPKRYPLSGTFELTVRCNLHCKMCLFRHDDAENPRLIADELSAEEWIDLARQAAESGTMNLLITGGEPLLRKDFCQIWKGIYQYGFLLELYTNATLVNDAIMETLREYPPHRIGVTIYGASADTYQRVCGNGAMYEKAIQGMKKLQTLPSQLSFRTTIIQDNYSDLPAIERMVNEDFHQPFSLISSRFVNKAVRGGCADAEACRLDARTNLRVNYFRGIEKLKHILGDLYDERNIVLEDTEPDSLDKKEKSHVSLLGCKAGMSQYTISWDGKLLGCQMLGLFYTDARQLGLREAWNRFPYTVKLPAKNSRCIKCEDQQLCSACPATIYAETGTLEGCPEYLCEDVKAIKELYRKKGISHGSDE